MVVQAVKLGGAYPYFLSCFLLLNVHPKGCRIRCSAPTENHSSYSTDFNSWSNTENYTNCYLGISTGRNFQLNSHFDGWDVNIWDSCQALGGFIVICGDDFPTENTKHERKAPAMAAIYKVPFGNMGFWGLSPKNQNSFRLHKQQNWSRPMGWERSGLKSNRVLWLAQTWRLQSRSLENSWLKFYFPPLTLPSTTR